ncbi:MAG: hypothetical protein KZQ92_04765 [Candidatus Thiodiazotropha sp. (ex Lucinoma borealis)]|nr:hypothetical protein [Candidatus Thiodiazotropha sp. (ex Lucinoma borealis)]MCU7863276.1 hypothetical protein [Candidatus Thiodiazotropha sp. (ex Lucinoma borealis)]MCU7866957.1 hypothetical protein [Candidatus Thiodiazotropha sp. (ex Lucinoma borealis)]
MSVIRLKLAFSLVSICLVITGCASNNFPENAFHGLNHVYQSNGTTLNVVFVHGMGDHPFGEKGVLKYQMKIAKALGFDENAVWEAVDWGTHCTSNYGDYLKYSYFNKAEKQRIDERRNAYQSVCPLRINEVIVGFIGWRQYRSPSDNKILNLFELSWDRATELLQKTILELDGDYYETVELDDQQMPIEGGVNRESDRALINRWMKKFVNQNLGDPVIYLGDYGTSIRRVIADGLSRISAAADMDDNYDYSIISDSLGSRIVFDTLGCVLDLTDIDDPQVNSACEYLNADTELTDDRLEGLKKMANNTTQVFMNANQLPLLALSNVRPPKEGEKENDWLNRFPCESGGPGLMMLLKKRDLTHDPLQIVAFTDPNDVLSYHLTTKFKNKCTHLDQNKLKTVEFINVRLPNVKWTYFGLFANPVRAHSTGFRSNDEAIDLLVNGYDADTQ